MIRMYKFTHREVTRVPTDGLENNAAAIPPEINLSNLTMFSTILFIDEFQQHGLGDSVDIAKTCNMSEWQRRIYAGKGPEEDDSIDIMALPAKQTSQAGLIYATTSGESSTKEAFTSFLFAHHKPSLPTTAVSSASVGTSNGHSLSSETQALIASKGLTHIWLCGSDLEQRRHRLMTRCLEQLEKDVLAWKESGDGSGVISVHTIPQVFPGMVRFLLKNGFHGGDRVVGGENGKVLYYKVL